MTETVAVKVDEMSRREFEDWFRSKHEGQMITKGEGYSEPITQLMWQAWKGSRAALVVELPEYKDHDDELSCFDGEYEWGNHAGAVYAVTQCATILRAAGITVKGDS